MIYLLGKCRAGRVFGKLAGFGIADYIAVETVKNNQVAHFGLDYKKLTESTEFASAEAYPPDQLPNDGKDAGNSPGTVVTLSKLKITRTISIEQFKKSIARRLLVLDADFNVYVNDQRITREEASFQFRFPKKPAEWKMETLENEQRIQWWAGFSKTPIPDEEQRGFVVYVRGKLAQTPWFFDLSGGAYGQHGLQYLTGGIKADFLDDSFDLIATDRGTVRWEDPIAAPLKEWGQKKVKELLKEWSEGRRKEKIKSPTVAMYLEQANKLPRREREIFKTVVDRICSIPQIDKGQDGKEIVDELVKFAYSAVTNRSFLEIIQRLNTASAKDLAQFEEALSEWDVIEAVNTARLVKGRIEIIRKFEQMIESDAREKPDMQNYLKEHPWLIDPKWAMLEHETSLDKTLMDKFHVSKPKGKEGRRRPDFFCLEDRHSIYVVEIKRPNVKATKKEFDQIRDYVVTLRNRFKHESSREEDSRLIIRGLLIADEIKNGHEEYKTAGAAFFDFRTWENLLRSNKDMHKDFLKAVKMRAKGDPRVEDLPEDE